MTVSRANWGATVRFTAEQRDELHRIVKSGRGIHPPPAVDLFLDDAEHHASSFTAFWRALVEQPPESRERAAEVLDAVSRHAQALAESIGRLDGTGSLPALTIVLERGWRAGIPFDPDGLELHLGVLSSAAAAARRNLPAGKRGPRVAVVEREFIGRVGLAYRERFGRAPAYSRGSSFPRLVSRLLDIAVPGHPHSVGDNGKLVRSALQAFDLVP
jgi:hypothetical protein